MKRRHWLIFLLLVVLLVSGCNLINKKKYWKLGMKGVKSGPIVLKPAPFSLDDGKVSGFAFYLKNTSKSEMYEISVKDDNKVITLFPEENISTGVGFKYDTIGIKGEFEFIFQANNNLFKGLDLPQKLTQEAKPVSIFRIRN
jgi:hypothetical protein